MPNRHHPLPSTLRSHRKCVSKKVEHPFRIRTAILLPGNARKRSARHITHRPISPSFSHPGSDVTDAIVNTLEVDHANAYEGAVSHRSRESGDQRRHTARDHTQDARHREGRGCLFTTMDGQRTMIAVFDLKAASDMPGIAEPLFMGLNASIQFMPCMNAEDLKTGLSTIK
jgi:hypothetical protein